MVRRVLVQRPGRREREVSPHQPARPSVSPAGGYPMTDLGIFVRDLLKLEEDTGDLVWYAPTRMYRYTAHPRAGRCPSPSRHGRQTRGGPPSPIAQCLFI